MLKKYMVVLCFLMFYFVNDVFATSIGAPKLIIKNSEYNFGTVAEGVSITHEFIVENQGNGPLHIKQIISSCGCTVADVDKKILAPNESTKLRVIFKTSGFSGEKYKTVRLYTNDVGTPEKILTLKGSIVSDVTVMPSRLNYGTQWYKNIKDGMAFLDVLVKAKNSDIKILDVFSSSKYLDVKILEKVQDNLKLRVFLKDTIPVGEFRDRVVVNLSGASKTAIDIPIFARIQGDVSLTPIALYFGTFDGGIKERVVRLNNLSNIPLKVTKISSSESFIKYKLVENEAGKSFDIVLNIDSKDVDEDLKGVLKVYTDNPNYEVLKLGVYGMAIK